MCNTYIFFSSFLSACNLTGLWACSIFSAPSCSSTPSFLICAYLPPGWRRNRSLSRWAPSTSLPQWFFRLRSQRGACTSQPLSTYGQQQWMCGYPWCCKALLVPCAGSLRRVHSWLHRATRFKASWSQLLQSQSAASSLPIAYCPWYRRRFHSPYASRHLLTPPMSSDQSDP